MVTILVIGLRLLQFPNMFIHSKASIKNLEILKVHQKLIEYDFVDLHNSMHHSSSYDLLN